MIYISAAAEMRCRYENADELQVAGNVIKIKMN